MHEGRERVLPHLFGCEHGRLLKLWPGIEVHSKLRVRGRSDVYRLQCGVEGGAGEAMQGVGGKSVVRYEGWR